MLRRAQDSERALVLSYLQIQDQKFGKGIIYFRVFSGFKFLVAFVQLGMYFLFEMLAHFYLLQLQDPRVIYCLF